MPDRHRIRRALTSVLAAVLATAVFVTSAEPATRRPAAKPALVPRLPLVRPRPPRPQPPSASPARRRLAPVRTADRAPARRRAAAPSLGPAPPPSLARRASWPRRASRSTARGREVPAPRAAAVDHLRPRDQRGAVRGERAGAAIDRQHHQGDDGAGVPRSVRRPVTGGQDRARRRRPRHTTYLRAGYKVTRRRRCSTCSLIGSDNAAARVLARVSPYG